MPASAEPGRACGSQPSLKTTRDLLWAGALVDRQLPASDEGLLVKFLRASAAAATFLSLTGCGANSDRPSPTAMATAPSAVPPSPSPSPSPSPVGMSRKAACQQVVEAAVDWTYLMARFSGDPSMEDISDTEVQDLEDRIEAAT